MDEMKISQLPEATEVNGNDYLTIVQSGLNKKIKALNTNLGKDVYTKTEVDDLLDEELSNKVDKVTGKGLSTNDFTDEYKTKIENLNEVVLWTNSNPTSDFAEQEITIPNLSDYTFIKVVYKQYKGTNVFKTSEFIYGLNYKSVLETADTSRGALWVRELEITANNKIRFEECKNNETQSTSNADIIPVYVIGYKINLNI